MSKAEGIKEELGWLKVVFGVLVAVDVSLVAWVAQNFSSPNRVLVSGAILAVAVVTAGVVWINRLAYRRIRELEQL
jgi:4-hydroxybenzoate polyprenyltransferase